MADSIWPTIHAERRALADDLSDLTDDDWATQSLCSEWDVHEVLAHQVSAAKMTPARFFAAFSSARFGFDRFAARQVALESAAGPAHTLAEFRNVQNRTTAPPGPKATWLGEAFVHGEDIRRPLGIHRDYPLPQVCRSIAFYASSNAVIGGRTRVAGLTLTATDADFSIGAGPLVEGPAISLLLAASGRPCALDERTGPGVDVLRHRA